MGLLEIIILAAVQGITEFLPISSSGHLRAAAEILGISGSTLVIDVAVHVGTLGAVIIYFWRDIARIIVGLFHLVTGPRPAGLARRRHGRHRLGGARRSARRDRPYAHVRPRSRDCRRPGDRRRGGGPARLSAPHRPAEPGFRHSPGRRHGPPQPDRRDRDHGRRRRRYRPDRRRRPGHERRQIFSTGCPGNCRRRAGGSGR